MGESKKFKRSTENLIAAFRGLPPKYSRARMRKESSLDSVMDGLVERFHINTRRPEEEIADRWVDVVGEYNSRHSHPVRLERGYRIFIHVTNPVVRQEMFFHRKMILERIKKLPACSMIRELVLRSG